MAALVTLVALLAPVPGHSQALFDHELLLTGGGGSQKDSRQTHRSVGADYAFLRVVRTDRQHLQVGISYTFIGADTDEFDELWAVSVYPQLSLYPVEDGALRRAFPAWAAPYFFVRALGPSYMSSKRLGDRRQSRHFAFQAQVGVGLRLDLGRQRQGLVSVSFKHLSNAGLFGNNDGIDVPLVLSLGTTL